MKRSRVDSLLLAALLLAFACGARAQTTRDAADLGGTSWQLVKFQGSDDTTLSAGRQGEVHDCIRGRWRCERANRLQPRARNVEVRGTESAPVRSARAHARDVPACTAERSHGQGLDAGAVVHVPGRPSLSIADGRRWHLRVRADRWIEIGDA